jgi:uncharacterized protein YbbC (DUF1343 family)
MVRTGLDRLLDDASALAGRRFGLLTHLAAVSDRRDPAHLALARAGALPSQLFGPEHGLFAVAQDMEPTADAIDPWTGVPIVSLYGDDEASLKPAPERFEGLDLLVIDLQDVGARYYTYAATAVWSAQAAIAAGCEIWVLDRPNPLGGLTIEGNRRRPGFESFIGAFELPVRHGLTLAELVTLELDRSEIAGRVRVWRMDGWQRAMTWEQTALPWMAPSPNVPTETTAFVYPGLCLIEATTLSEGRGTTRPFQLVGGPGIDPPELAEALRGQELPGVDFVPTTFRPEFQKHEGTECGGVEIVVTDRDLLRPFRLGVELILELGRHPGFGWREEPYEFVSERPAIDLLCGSEDLRRAVEAGEEPTAWIASWSEDEAEFARLREPYLLYD